MTGNYMLMKAALFLSKLITLYSFIIWTRILLSWVNPYSRPGSLTYYFAMLVDPFLNLFRSKHFRVGMLDFSPIFAIATLSLVQSVANVYAAYGVITLGLILALMLNIIWNYGVSFFFLFAIISLIFRTLTSFTGSTGMMWRFGSMTGSLAGKVRNLFFKRRLVHDSTVNLITLILMLLFYVAARYLYVLLFNLCGRIPF
jgi:YGGT family.